jgi:hypothetical protein
MTQPIWGLNRVPDHVCLFFSFSFSFSFFFFFNFFIGAAVRRVAEELSEVSPEGEKFDENFALCQAFEGAGLFYTNTSKEMNAWVLLFGRSLFSSVHVEDPERDGVAVSWESEGPTDEELHCMTLETKLSAHHWTTHKTKTKLFLSSPLPLDTDTSKMKKRFIPEGVGKWLYVMIPFHTESHDLVVMTPFLIPSIPPQTPELPIEDPQINLEDGEVSE